MPGHDEAHSISLNLWEAEEPHNDLHTLWHGLAVDSLASFEGNKLEHQSACFQFISDLQVHVHVVIRLLLGPSRFL